MAIAVKRHLDRAMAEQGLHPLGRKVSLDRPRREEVAQPMESIFRAAGAVDDPGRDLKRAEAAVSDIGMVLDPAVAVREDEPQAPLPVALAGLPRTSQLPFL